MAMEMPTMATNTSGMSEKQRQRHYEVEDALHIVRRAGEIMADKKLMAEVEKMADERAEEMNAISKKAGKLAKLGRISDKQMASLGKR